MKESTDSQGQIIMRLCMSFYKSEYLLHIFEISVYFPRKNKKHSHWLLEFFMINSFSITNKVKSSWYVSLSSILPYFSDNIYMRQIPFWRCKSSPRSGMSLLICQPSGLGLGTPFLQYQTQQKLHYAFIYSVQPMYMGIE